MAHYECKGCLQRDCICPKEPPRIIPDDGRHWKNGKYHYGMQFCSNCEQSYYIHVMNNDKCPTPRKGEVWDHVVAGLSRVRTRR